MALLNKLPWFRKPHPILEQNMRLFDDFDQGKPLQNYEFVVCDTELTGLNKRKDEIISIGAVKIVNLQVVLSDTFYTLVKPKKITPSKATLVHRITPEELEKAKTIEEVLPDFIDYLGSSLLVGHFVTIDVHFLNKACKKFLGGTLSNPNIDTMRLAKAYRERKCRTSFGGHCDMSDSYSLDNLVEEFELPRFKPHNALEDALQTAYLFLFLIKKMRKGGVKTLRELYKAGRSPL